MTPVGSLELPEAPGPSERELQMAEQLVASLTSPFEPERYPDVHRERVLELVHRKAEGEAIEAPPEEAPAKVVSLADALAASLAAAHGKEAPAPHAGPERGELHHRAGAAARRARKPPRKRRA